MNQFERVEQELFKTIFVNATMGIAIADAHGILIKANQAFYEIVGYTEAELLGTPMLDKTHPDDRERNLDLMRQLLDGMISRYVLEKRYVHKDGSTVWVRTTVSLGRDDEGRPVHTVALVEDISEKKLADLAREESEKKYRILFEVSPQIVWMAGADGYLTYCNQQQADYTGLTAEQARGNGWLECVHPDHRDRVMKVWQTAARIGADYEVDFPLRRFDGVYRWFMTKGQAAKDADGNVLHWVGVGMDIDARKVAEENEREAAVRFAAVAEAAREALFKAQSLQADRAHLLHLFNQAPGFIFTVRGPEHVFELANKAYYQVVGHREIIGKPMREAMPEVEGQGYFELLDKVIATGEPYVGRGLEVSFARTPGAPPETKFVDFVYQPTFGPEGNITGIFCQGIDVTEQKIAEDEVQRNQLALEQLIVERTTALEEARKALQHAQELQGDKAHLLSLFDQAPGFMVVFSGPEHVFELVNKAYYQLVGNRIAIGKTVRDALPDLAGQGYFELLDQVFSTGETFIGRGMLLILQKEPGGEREEAYVDFVYQPIIGTGGTITGIFVQGSDVTPQQRAQEELKRYQNDLENLVTERTHALNETRTALEHAQKMESIGKLTGGVAHDFNNVLQIIGGNIQLIQLQVRDNTKAMKRLDSVAAAVERGAKLSSQLLAFARRQPLAPAVINLERVVRGMDDLLRRALGESIKVEISVVEDIWNTLVDPHQLENVIINLAINASDAMQGTGTLLIEIDNVILDEEYAASQADVVTGPYVLLSVSDTGSGMSPETMAHAFEPFFTTKPAGQGTGLGLSMAYGFVRQSEGHIFISSEQGRGTTIKIYLPRSYAQETELEFDSRLPIIGGLETILVVEDDLAVQKTVVDILSALGYNILKADDAQSALDILQSGRQIDLLFTDVVMPGSLSTPELARQAKLLHPAIEVLFTSGYTQNAFVHAGRLDPDVNLLSKPYRREQLAVRIRSLLSNRMRVPMSAKAISRPIDAGAAIDDVEEDTPKMTGQRILVVEDNLDAQQMACELLAMLGHTTQGVGSAEEALEVLTRERFDILFTDISLPRMNGVELAERVAETHAAMKVIFASGYGAPVRNWKGFEPVMLHKPYDIAELQRALA